MLILSRKANEKVSLFDKQGNFIASITVTDIRGRTAKIGIDADRDTVDIIRDELIEGLNTNGTKIQQ